MAWFADLVWHGGSPFFRRFLEGFRLLVEGLSSLREMGLIDLFCRHDLVLITIRILSTSYSWFERCHVAHDTRAKGRAMRITRAQTSTEPLSASGYGGLSNGQVNEKNTL